MGLFYFNFFMENADKKFLAKTFQEEEVKRRCCIYP